MEEDIKILEKLVNYWNSLINYAESDKKGIVYKWINTEGIVEYRDALENLLNRVKELEEKDDLVKYCRGPLPKDTTAIMMCNDEFCRNFGNDFIPKSKIKEKIEELKKEGDYRSIDNPKGRVHFQKEPVDYQIQVLQELLEEE